MTPARCVPLGLAAWLAASSAAAQPPARTPGTRVVALYTGLTLGALAGGATAFEGVSGAGWSSGAAAATVWGGATLGLSAGLALEATLRPDPGASAWVLSGGMWGATLAGLTGVALRDGDSVGRWVLVGEAVGVIATMATARALRPTRVRTRWMDLGGAVGGLLGFGAGLLLFSRPSLDWAGVIATTELAILGGGVAGWFFGASRDDDGRQVRAGGGAPRAMIHPTPGGLAIGISGETPF